MESSYKPDSVLFWCNQHQEWKDSHADVHEVNNLNNTDAHQWSKSFRIIFPYHLTPNQVGYVRYSNSSSDMDQYQRRMLENKPDFEFKQNGTRIQFSQKSTNTTGDIGVEFYMSSQDDDYPEWDNTPAGAYTFKTARDHFSSYPYFEKNSTSIAYSYSPGIHSTQWEFKFLPKHQNKTGDNRAAVLRFLDHGNHTNGFAQMTFELNGIPVMEDFQGKDVVATFHFDDFHANQTFYTDSNGLEMQKRILNYRETFPWTQVQNISGNFFPVDSAIAMRDLDSNGTAVKQATVLNDRSMAGSAELQNSTIELLHNRRMVVDDNKGVDEVLNETDSNGMGI